MTRDQDPLRTNTTLQALCRGVSGQWRWFLALFKSAICSGRTQRWKQNVTEIFLYLIHYTKLSNDGKFHLTAHHLTSLYHLRHKEWYLLWLWNICRESQVINSLEFAEFTFAETTSGQETERRTVRFNIKISTQDIGHTLSL